MCDMMCYSPATRLVDHGRGYDSDMTTPVPYVETGAIVRPPSVVSPSAMAGPQPSAAYRLGEVLKELIHKAGVFLDENSMLAAVSAVDTFVRAYVPPSALPALVTGEERAPVEDVSKRIPPRTSNAPVAIPAAVELDYNKLAQAILAAQQAQAQVTS